MSKEQNFWKKRFMAEARPRSGMGSLFHSHTVFTCSYLTISSVILAVH